MRVLLFGASGMVGQGILRECLLAADVTEVLSIGRSPLLQKHPKLKEILLPNLFDIATAAYELTNFDAVFFPLGVSSFRMSEADYRYLTYDLTMNIATLVAKQSPEATFCYVSGAGTDANSKTMWARVKGELENALMRLPFADAFMFRPGAIRPLHGIKTKTPLYNAIYLAFSPVVPLLMKLFPRHITTTEEVGLAMLAVARKGYPKPILEPVDIRRAAGIAI
ncbi:Rossmann-fold NAD(P)-binding domain-containing protein [Terriglobus tenax]|uniref:epimerase n=1 Tax=Terriglobus tenax TaxID=1111115 RepID=UPI0021DFC2F1|nr:epimerase [Terriglobus tenax]